MNSIFSLPNSRFNSTSSNLYFGNSQSSIIYAEILGARQFGNLAFMALLFIGGFGFLIAGLVTYITSPSYITEISYIPQGILLTFYGAAALTLCAFIGFTLKWNVGSGYNEINKRDQLIRIQRKGYPGKSQSVLLTYEISDVKSLEIKITEGINPTQVIYLCMKNERQIPLIFTDQLPTITKTEQRATLLCNFLKVPLEIKTLRTV